MGELGGEWAGENGLGRVKMGRIERVGLVN